MTELATPPGFNAWLWHGQTREHQGDACATNAGFIKYAAGARHRTDQQRKSRRRINVVFARIPRAALTLLSILRRRARSTTSNICYGRCRMKLLKLITMKMAGVYWSRRTAAILSGTRCGIYADRPQICRGHSNDYCEFDAPAEDGFDLYFPNYQVLLKYCKKRFKRWECR
jgi:hypothetical protein